MPISLVDSDVKAVATASAQFDITMIAGAQYILSSDTAAWFKIGSNPTASVGDGSHFIPAGGTRLVAAQGANNKVAIIRSSADGNASLSLVQGVI